MGVCRRADYSFAEARGKQDLISELVLRSSIPAHRNQRAHLGYGGVLPGRLPFSRSTQRDAMTLMEMTAYLIMLFPHIRLLSLRFLRPLLPLIPPPTLSR